MFLNYKIKQNLAYFLRILLKDKNISTSNKMLESKENNYPKKYNSNLSS